MQHLVIGCADEPEAFHAHDGWTEQQGCEKLTLHPATSQTSLSIVTLTPSTWIVVVASADAANEVSKQERKTANNNSRRTPLHCAIVR